MSEPSKLVWHPKLSRPSGQNESDARREILDAAAETFMENGYAGASIDDIADRLNATKGRVYHHYRSKLDILLDIHTGILEHMIRVIRPVAERTGSPTERLSEMAHLHVLLVIHNLAPARVTLHAISDTYNTRKQMEAVGDIAKMRNEYEGFFHTVVHEGGKAGEFTVTEPDLVVKAILGCLNWIPIWYRPDDPRTVSAEVVAEHFAAFVRNGVGVGVATPR